MKDLMNLITIRSMYSAKSVSIIVQLFALVLKRITWTKGLKFLIISRVRLRNYRSCFARNDFIGLTSHSELVPFYPWLFQQGMVNNASQSCLVPTAGNGRYKKISSGRKGAKVCGTFLKNTLKRKVERKEYLVWFWKKYITAIIVYS